MRFGLPFALRVHARRPLVTLIVVLTLGLAIGATTTVFSIVYPIILQPLGLPDADRLVLLFEAYPKGSRYVHGSDRSFISVRPGTFDDWKRQSQSFEAVAAFMLRSVVIGGRTSTESSDAQAVTDGFFETLRTPAFIGRTLAADDYRDGGRPVAVLAYDLWRTRFGGDRSVVGRSIHIDGAAHEVVGVMPPGFYPTRYGKPSLWAPLMFDSDLRGSRVRWGLLPIARLRPGVSVEQAQREMDVISDRLTHSYPEHYDNMCAVVAPMAGYLSGRYERLFSILLSAVVLVLLVACANIASLLLARAIERDREFAIRAALGASRSRVAGQALAESLALAVPGALIGLGLASLALPAVLRLLPETSRIPRLDEVHVNGPVLLFTIGVTVLTTVLVGLAPAWRGLHTHVASVMNDARRGSSPGIRTSRASRVLIVGEVAVTFVLLVGGVLLLRTLQGLMQTESGVRTSQVLAVSLVVPAHAYGAYEVGGANPTRAQLFSMLERELGSLPGVTSAGVMTSLPLRHGPNPWAMHIEGRAAPASESAAYSGAHRMAKTGLYNHGEVSTQRVTPGYFPTFGIPLVQGRLFDDRDTADRPGVALINATAARRYFAGEDPIGRTIVIDMTSYFPRLTIVGIVGDSRLNGVDREVIPQVFWPMAQRPGSNAWVALRSAGNPAILTAHVRERIGALAPDVALDETTTMETALADSLWQPRLSAVLIGGFAAVALLLAAGGIYGLFSQFVNQRTRELGVRLALGASRRHVAWLVLGRALRLTVCGVAIGTVAALWLGRTVAGQLHGVSSNDAVTFVVVGCLLVGTAAAATVVPLLRAVRIDSAAALRDA